MIAVCLKWADHRPEVDPLTGQVRTDPRTSGASDADRAALEWALRLGEAWEAEVVAVTAGTAEAEPMLREAVAAGADRAVRVSQRPEAQSPAVAAALAGALPDSPDVVVCGAWSVDRGSGSVPAFLAARLGAAQALGVISLSPGTKGDLGAERRLDGGRRERLRLRAPAVVSVEGGSAQLRRASLDGVLRARDVKIDTVTGPPGGTAVDAVRTGPFRPRARVLPGPRQTDARDRILALTGALVDREPPVTLTLDPAAAADAILDRLRAWGYIA